MNRRQEIASWVFGVLVAAASNAEGRSENDWLFTAVIPLFIVGVLLVYSLRTRAPEIEPKAAKMFSAGTALVVLFCGYGYMLERINDTNRSAANATSAADRACDKAEEARHAAETAGDKATQARFEAEAAKNEVSYLRIFLR